MYSVRLLIHLSWLFPIPCHFATSRSFLLISDVFVFFFSPYFSINAASSAVETISCCTCGCNYDCVLGCCALCSVLCLKTCMHLRSCDTAWNPCASAFVLTLCQRHPRWHAVECRCEAPICGSFGCPSSLSLILPLRRSALIV